MRLPLLILIVAVGVVGCTASTGIVRPAREIHTSVTPVNRIPADVLVRVSSEIQNLKTVVRPSTHAGSAWSYPLVVGPALSQSLTDLARSTFRSVTEEASAREKASISFDLVEFNAEMIGLGTGNSISVEVSVRSTITDSSGRTVFSVVSSGTSQRVAGYDLVFDASKFAKGNPVVADLERTSQRAIEDMIQRLAAAISSNGDIRKALASP